MDQKNYLLQFAFASVAVHLGVLFLISSVEPANHISISPPDEYQPLQITLNMASNNIEQKKPAKKIKNPEEIPKQTSRSTNRPIKEITESKTVGQHSSQDFMQAIETRKSVKTNDAKPEKPSKNTKNKIDEIASLESRNAMIKNKLDALVKQNFSYPRFAIRRGWQGTVELGLRIEANGRLSKLRIVKTSGYKILDQAALTTLAKASYISDIESWMAGDVFDTILPVKYQLIDG